MRRFTNHRHYIIDPGREKGFFVVAIIYECAKTDAG
jgi:hypothetical protein